MDDITLIARHWINGKRTEVASRRDSINLVIGQVICTSADRDEAEVKLAVSVAKYTFLNSTWRGNCSLRATAISEKDDCSKRHAGCLVKTVAFENGKIKTRTLFKVAIVSPKLRFYAVLSLTDCGRTVKTALERYSIVLKEPMRVVRIIAPWNTPVVLVIRSLAAALATGCTVIGEMLGFAAQPSAWMCEICAEMTSLPLGVLNFFSGVSGARAWLSVDSPEFPTPSFIGVHLAGRRTRWRGPSILSASGLSSAASVRC